MAALAAWFTESWGASFCHVAQDAYASTQSAKTAKRLIAAWAKDWAEQEYPQAIDLEQVNWLELTNELINEMETSN